MLGNDPGVTQSRGCRLGGELPRGGCALQAWGSSGLGSHGGSLRGPGVPRAGGLLSCECHISKCVGFGVC